MPTISRAPGLPNILIVDGIDPTTNYRTALRNALYAAGSSSPVHRGTHDFWNCFPFPEQPEGNPTSPNFGGEDESAREAGRALLGIGDMRRLPPDPSVVQMQGRVFTLLHEAAHAWLVPADMHIRVNNNNVTPLTAGEVTNLLNQERPFPKPALLARQDAHWSCYVNFNSCMDGLAWDRLPGTGRLMKWVQRNPPPIPVRPPNLLAIETNAVYSDLDLLFMGLKNADQCFPETNGQFYWLEPKLSLGDPMRYFAGLFIAFSRTDYMYFGFYNDHGKLRVERSSNSQRSDIVDIGPVYQPMLNEYEAMMLRVVKRGNQYIFQACHGNSASAVLSGRGPFMFDGTATVQATPQQGNFSSWQTITSFTAAETPQAIGVMTKTWNPILAEAQFFSFEVQQGTVNNSMTLYNVAPAAVGIQSFNTLPADRLVAETPQAGALFRRRNFSTIMGVPYASSYDHWSTADNAPKMMMRAPAGDFSFGVTAKVHRSLVSPWAGGAAAGMTMWGVEQSANARDVIVPQRISRNWPARTPNSPVIYKQAYIVVTNRRSAIYPSHLQTLDVFRRYCDNAFGAVTRGLAIADSTL